MVITIMYAYILNVIITNETMKIKQTSIYFIFKPFYFELVVFAKKNYNILFYLYKTGEPNS